jgi:polyisoprenoid-binding protein YceI
VRPILLAAALGILHAPHPVAAATWEIDTAESELVVRTGRAGLLAFAGHRHVIRGGRFSGEVQWDPTGQAAPSLRVDVDAASLVVADDDLAPGDLVRVQQEMQEKVLKVDTHPRIAFRSTAVEPDGAAWHVKGVLDLHGQSQELELPVQITSGEDRLELTGEFEIRQRDYGIEPIAVGLGVVKVKNEVRVAFRIIATPGTEASH